MALSTLWWVLTAAAVIAELVTGTFYLLMFAIGLAAGAVAAHAGLGLEGQMLVAAVVAASTVFGWHYYRTHHLPAPAPAERNPDVNMDVGETVQVDAWRPDGTALVRYRGAQWTVEHAAGQPGVPGKHRVVEVVGSRLRVDPV